MTKSVVCYAQDASNALSGSAVLCKCTHLVVPYANTEVFQEDDDDAPALKLDRGTNKIVPRNRLFRSFAYHVGDGAIKGIESTI